MKRNFTRILAAFALLVGLAIPLGMWGQTRDTQTVSYGWETTDDAEPWTISDAIVATSGEGNTGTYAGKINTNSTTVQFNEKVYVTSFSYAFKRTSTNNNYSVYIETSTDGSNWSIKDTQAMNTFTNGSYRTVTKEFDGTQELYVRFRCYNTTAIRYVDDVTITYSTSAAQLDPCDLTLTNASSSIVFDLYNNSDAYVINYTTSSTGEVTVENSDYITTEVDQVNKTITVTPVAVTNGAKVITVNQAADDNYAAGSKTFTINITDSTPFAGGVVTFVAGTDTGTSTGQNEDQMTKSGVTVHSTKAALATSEYRLYSGSTTTISTIAGTITEIVFTGSNTSYPVSNLSVNGNNGTYTTNNNVGTWTGDATSVSFSASAQARASQIAVTVEMSTEPSFVITNNEVLAYDATSGSFNYTINNPVQGGYLTVDDISLWISDAMAEDGLVTFNTEINPAATSREGIIRMQYTYHGELMTYDVTITQAGAPVIYSTIPDLFAAATSTATNVNVTFGNWVVSGVSGSNVFVTDNDGNGFIIYTSNHGFAVNDKLSGTVMGTPLKLYNGSAEFTNLTKTTDGISVSDDGTITVITDKTIADLGGVNTGAVITLNNLTYDGTNLTDGTNTIKPYSTLYNGTFVSGKTYNVTGVYQQYNNTKEILPRSADDIEEVVVTTPIINAENVNIAYDATSGEIAYTITNPVDGQNLTATSTADWISNINVGSESVTFTTTANEGDTDRSATITLSYTGATDKEITVTQGHYVVDYATLPFEYDGNGTGDLPNGFTVSGLGTYSSSPAMKFDGTGDYAILKFNERPGTLTFDIKGNTFSGSTFTVQTSEDGVTYTDLETYTELGNTQSEEFTNLGENVRYIKWVYTYKSSGNVGLGNITLGEYVAPQPSITVESNVINVDAESHQDYLNVTFVNFEPTTGYAFTCDANGTFTDYSWLVAELDINNNRVRYTIGNNEEVARTGYFRVKCGDVYSEIVTVNQAAYVPPFEPATYIPTTEINPDKRYIIVGFNDGDAYAMGYQKTNNRDAVGISMNGTTALVETSDVYEFILAEEGDGYTIYDERTPGYLYAASSSSNLLKTEAELDVHGNGVWSIGFTEEPGQFNIVAFNSSNHNVMQFNQGSSLFSCYETASQSPVYLYEKVEDAEYTLEITGYTDDSEKTGYHLIASPVFVDPYLVGMADGDFDLYSFDQSEEEEWRNYEAGSFTMLEPGKGYLYAKKATDNVQTYYFNLSGTPYVGDGYIDLAYDANEGVSFPGLNLIGNPFGEEATLNIPYYRLNSTGSGLEAVNETESPVNVMEGVFVYAEYNAEYGYVTNYAQFTPNGNTSGGGGMKINLTRNRGTAIDRAIVRFDEGQQLPKFQLFENSTKLYIPQGNEDYAIVRSAAQGEMPVSFRASENGTYTIAVEAENVDMNYLHLIDNMTGADVDLLATPNYTFEARTNDYTSRFRLVFSANGIDEQNAETFAFFNGSSWTVSNTGDATLQVVDITGRIISSETINGNATVSLNQPAGIYMLRLVNGNDVKVQKVVVR